MSMCDLHEESGKHVLLHCQATRSAWFASGLAFHSDAVQGNIQEAFCSTQAMMDGVTFAFFINLMWAIWKRRCAFIYEGKEWSQAILKEANDLVYNAKCARLLHIAPTQVSPDTGQNTQGTWALNSHKCYTDGSYIISGGGWAYVLQEGDRLVQYQLKHVALLSPFHSEALEILQAVKAVIAKEVQSCLLHGLLTPCSSENLYRTVN